MAPFSPPQAGDPSRQRRHASRSSNDDAPEQSEPPPLLADSVLIPPTLNTSMLSFQQSPESLYYSSSFPSSTSAASRLNAPTTDVMSTAYSLFVPPDPWRRPVQVNLPSQSVQQPLTETSPSLPQVHFTPQPGTYLPPRGISSTPMPTTQEHERQQQQPVQLRPQLLSAQRHTDIQYAALRSSNEAANQDNTSTRFQPSVSSQTWSTSRPPSVAAPPQRAAQSYYSATSLIPPGYGLPPANQQPGVSGSNMSGMQVLPPSTPVSTGESHSIALYGPPSNLIQPPERQQPSLQQQPSLDQSYGIGPRQNVALPTIESRSKMRRFRYVFKKRIPKSGSEY
ncbi:hypothetical protein V1525DRAFT_446986 [Lipomyces kononenkoae]|uniref:Uncharacterized protein n=1 Tax=Lipomyces kononenkoae TaxID=34357 RepID=A0ACC3T7I4_LIPKO